MVETRHSNSLRGSGGELDSRFRGNDGAGGRPPFAAAAANAKRGTEGCGANDGGTPPSGLWPATFPAREDEGFATAGAGGRAFPSAGGAGAQSPGWR